MVMVYLIFEALMEPDGSGTMALRRA